MKLSATLALLVVGLAGTLAAPTDAVAQPRGRAAKPPKAPRACGVSAIPLALGNEWTYEPVPPPPERALTEAQVRLTPIQPKRLVVKVTAIEAKNDGTHVTLTEDHDGRVHTTTLRCTAGGTFSVAPDAFWFAGEPGITYGIELANVERKGQTLNLAAGKLTGFEWWDDVKATWKHVPTAKATPRMHGGTLEIVRHFVVLPEEKLQLPIGEKAGEQLKAIKLGLETTVKVTLDPAPPQPLKAPPMLVNFFWFVDGMGPVQVLNSYGQQYVLTRLVSN
ncbi:MAG: hypothetical protein HS111_24040 [Kofleriaceae bacterium]|nr:hypothetical protein [Kofleriaceae bacterium]MCL4224072.1 hypothetical protein [Myxococcales bacterium]